MKYLGALLALSLAGPASAAELVMVQQPGCYYCQRWNEEIAPAYPNTDEGQYAPLRRVELRAIPDDIAISRRVSYTPTFLLVDQGREIARLEGYPGAHFFWPLLDELLMEHTDYQPEAGTKG